MHILHLHSTFAPGGKEMRAVRLIDAPGHTATYSIASAVPGALGARAASAPDIDARFPADAPLLPGFARRRGRPVGAANRAVAADRFDEGTMIAAYRGLYQAAAQGLLVS
ncbi:hypothetical protein ACMT1E_02010 [Sphingomonas flavalba]|uniref:hypothetical protein n=1 Tax=Sphingomonas flavalba TaxID=2559804 RepID=UPI0039E015D0